MNKKIKVHLLVNEVAGNGNAVAAYYSLQKVLKNLNILFSHQISHQKSHYPGELIKLAQDYANTNPTPNDILIVVGGD